MRKMKKIASLMMALVMVMAMSVTAFAADIEVQNAKVGETYSAYQIFTATTAEVTTTDAEGNVSTSTVYTYYINPNSEYYTDIKSVSNLATDEEKGEGWEQLFTLVGPNSDGNYQVTVTDSEKDDKVIAYLTGLGAKGDAAGQVTASETGETVSATITELGAGYYFVTTTTGSVVSIGTTGTTEIKEKNSEPTVEKEETTDGTAGIGDKVEFSATIKDAAGISKLVYHDTMSEGLTFNDDVVVNLATIITGDDGGTVATKGEVLTANTDYTVVTTELADNCTFEVQFTDTGLAKITDAVVITYSATVNENAVIDSTGNTNEGSLSYGNSSTSETSKTTTKVYDFDIKKTDGTNVLSGAEFTLIKEGSEDLISFVAVEGGYRVATAAEIEDTGVTTTTTITAGTINISGLDAGTYTLTETKAPDGYNQLSDPLTVTINEDGSVTFDNSTVTTVTVVNQAGSSLPSTGGIGTTIFYVVGTVLVLGAAVVLITRRRMSSEA